jgi:hypothetical protein
MRKRVLATLVAVGCGIYFRWISRPASRLTSRKIPPPLALAEVPRDLVLRRYLMYFMLPLWFIPGILDYIWHRKSHIETTSGTEESLIHMLMMTEVGVPILAGMLLEIDAGVLALMLAAFALHGLTAMWDVSFAVSRRLVLPREQHTHSFLEMLPFCAVSFAVCLHWEQFAALFGRSSEAARFDFRWKQPPLPRSYVTTIAGLIFLFIMLPYSEELLRCLGAQQRGLIGSETPPCAPALFGGVS